MGRSCSNRRVLQSSKRHSVHFDGDKEEPEGRELCKTQLLSLKLFHVTMILGTMLDADQGMPDYWDEPKYANISAAHPGADSYHCCQRLDSSHLASCQGLQVRHVKFACHCPENTKRLLRWYVLNIKPG